MYNSSATIITKGTPVCMSSTGVSVISLAGLTSTRYFGIAMEDIQPSASGVVRVGGYLPIADTLLTGLVIGDKIGLVDGALAKVTTGDYIGLVTLTGYIKLI